MLARRDLSVAAVRMLVADFRRGHRDPITGAAIGRRGLGMAFRQRPAGPRPGQRTVAGTPLNRPEHHRDHGWQTRQFRPTGRTRCDPVHRRTPACRGQDRSGRKQQKSLLPIKEER